MLSCLFCWCTLPPHITILWALVCSILCAHNPTGPQACLLPSGPRHNHTLGSTSTLYAQCPASTPTHSISLHTLVSTPVCPSYGQCHNVTLPLTLFHTSPSSFHAFQYNTCWMGTTFRESFTLAYGFDSSQAILVLLFSTP